MRALCTMRSACRAATERYARSCLRFVTTDSWVYGVAARRLALKVCQWVGRFDALGRLSLRLRGI